MCQIRGCIGVNTNNEMHNWGLRWECNIKELLSEGGIPKLELLVIKLVFSSITRLKTELKGT